MGRSTCWCLVQKENFLVLLHVSFEVFYVLCSKFGNFYRDRYVLPLFLCMYICVTSFIHACTIFIKLFTCLKNEIHVVEYYRFFNYELVTSKIRTWILKKIHLFVTSAIMSIVIKLVIYISQSEWAWMNYELRKLLKPKKRKYSISTSKVSKFVTNVIL